MSFQLCPKGATLERSSKRGTVQRVLDGDTIDVRLVSGRRERVRLIGINAPELNPLECFGAEARAAAQRLAYRKRVLIVGDRTQATRDRYGQADENGDANCSGIPR